VQTSLAFIEKFLRFAAPALLCVVAARQIALVRTERLTPWKGGGFGMFATVESGATRIVKIRLERRDGEKVLALPVRLPPELAPELTNLAQRPTHAAAENLAIVLSRLPWQEARELDELYRLSAPEFASLAVSSQVQGKTSPLLQRVIEAPRAWIAGLKSSAKFGEGKRVDFDYAAVEVWQLEFDKATRTLAARRIIDASEQAARNPTAPQKGAT
jgi:hypothetical protein